MTTMTPALTEQVNEGAVDVRTLTDEFDLIGALRQLNELRPGQAWAFYSDPRDRRAAKLTVGLNADLGFVTWWDGHTSTHPVMTTATGDMVDYWNGAYHTQVDQGRQIPAAYVFAAVAEFVATRSRPHIIPWPAHAA